MKNLRRIRGRDHRRDRRNNPKEEEVVPSMENIAVKSHRERPILPGSERELYDHVGWRRPGSKEDIGEVLEAGPAVGAWDGDRLVGFARALSDGRFAAYVEDVMVHEAYRRRSVGEEIVALLLEEIGAAAKVSLFCEPPVTSFYEANGFRRTSYLGVLYTIHSI
jgi:ribosomal protein S18 acetylase RimI-like enzyme